MEITDIVAGGGSVGLAFALVWKGLALAEKVWEGRKNGRPTTGPIDPVEAKLCDLIELSKVANNLSVGQTELLKDHSRDHQSMSGAMGRIEDKLNK